MLLDSVPPEVKMISCALQFSAFAIAFLESSIIFFALAAWLSSGSLLSENMSPVGVNPLIMSAVVAGQLLLALLLLYIFPLLFKKKVKQG